MAMSIIQSAKDKGKRSAFVCNRIGLVKQASTRFYKSHIHHGIIQGENSRSTWHDTLICSIDTLARRGYPENLDLLIIDEAHGATSKSYTDMIAAHQHIPIIGLSATPFTKGLGRELEFGKLFESLVVASTISDLIAMGYLVDCEIYAPSTPDLRGIKINRFGDYDEKQLGAAVDKPGLIGDIVGHWCKYANGMPTVIFATNIAHSQHICAQFIAAGITAEHIDCFTPDETRIEILDRHNSGVTTIVSNVSVLAEGWDSPLTQCMILARPTRSLARWIQMVGRALRPHPGKDRALILDHSGTCHRLGYPTDDLPLELDDGKKKEYDQESKPQEERLPHECANCHFMIPAGVGACPKCGCVPQRQNKIKSEDGELTKVERGPKMSQEQKQEIWSSVLGLREERNTKRIAAGKAPLSDGWAANLYKSITKVWPRGMQDVSIPPIASVRSMATANDIRFIKRRV